MTPVEWARIVEVRERQEEIEGKNRIRLAWLTAKLSRVDTMPSIEELTTPPIEAVELSAEETQRQEEFQRLVFDKIEQKLAGQSQPT